MFVSDVFSGNITDEVLSLNYAQDVEGSKDKKRNGIFMRNFILKLLLFRLFVFKLLFTTMFW